MPKIFLSPSTQEWNQYVTGGNEEEYMNLLADRMEPYLRSSGITYVRNDPSRNVVGAISDSFQCGAGKTCRKAKRYRHLLFPFKL